MILPTKQRAATCVSDEGVRRAEVPLLRQVGISGGPLCKSAGVGWGAALGVGRLQSAQAAEGPQTSPRSLFPGSCPKPLEYLKAEQNKKYRDTKASFSRRESYIKNNLALHVAR